MTITNDYAARLASVEELPYPFRLALSPHIEEHEAVDYLIYSPSVVTPGWTIPASVLAVVGQRWLTALDDKSGHATVTSCDFSNTLLLEMTSVLLHGQLKIDYIADNMARSSAVVFNTVIMKEYRSAAEHILRAIEGPTVPNDPALDIKSHISTWPYKFRNLAPAFVPDGQLIRSAVFWPAIHGGFHRELAPSAALLLTGHEIIIFAEEKAPWWHIRRDEIKLGEIVTYCPLSRVARFSISHNDRLGILTLDAHTAHGGEKLDIVFAPDQNYAISEFMDRAMVSA